VFVQFRINDGLHGREVYRAVNLAASGARGMVPVFEFEPPAVIQFAVSSARFVPRVDIHQSDQKPVP
jgi:hypothetical protein